MPVAAAAPFARPPAFPAAAGLERLRSAISPPELVADDVEGHAQVDLAVALLQRAAERRGAGTL